eukprot:2809787-Rhodomonas_salina.1
MPLQRLGRVWYCASAATTVVQMEGGPAKRHLATKQTRRHQMQKAALLVQTVMAERVFVFNLGRVDNTSRMTTVASEGRGGGAVRSSSRPPRACFCPRNSTVVLAGGAQVEAGREGGRRCEVRVRRSQQGRRRRGRRWCRRDRRRRGRAGAPRRAASARDMLHASAAGLSLGAAEARQEEERLCRVSAREARGGGAGAALCECQCTRVCERPSRDTLSRSDEQACGGS